MLAILPHFYTKQNPHPLAVLMPLLVLAVPLADLAWVVVLRWAGPAFWLGDTNHLSHRLVRRGLSRPRAVLLIWLLAAPDRPAGAGPVIKVQKAVPHHTERRCCLAGHCPFKLRKTSRNRSFLWRLDSSA